MKCAVKNCVNEQKNKEKISFFLFPKNQQLLQQWLNFCENNQPFKEKSWRVCMDHFKDEDIQGDLQFRMELKTKRTLKPGAVPCINFNNETEALKRLQHRKNNKKMAFLFDNVDESAEAPEVAKTPKLSEAPELAETMEIEPYEYRNEHTEVIDPLTYDGLDNSSGYICCKIKDEVENIYAQSSYGGDYDFQ